MVLRLANMLPCISRFVVDRNAMPSQFVRFIQMSPYDIALSLFERLRLNPCVQSAVRKGRSYAGEDEKVPSLFSWSSNFWLCKRRRKKEELQLTIRARAHIDAKS